ncbi:MAG: Xaa-Pro peptidase family protein [Candidatus Nanoarchaeia archaeon]|nr:Xaa-Pro peptidase family protein [Candidatus Nanoarchaeia archaeon]
MLKELDEFMGQMGVEAIILHGKFNDTNIYYLTKNKVTSSSFVIKTIGKKPVLLTWPEKEYSGDVRYYTDYDIISKTREFGRIDAYMNCIKRIMEEEGIEKFSAFGSVPGKLFDRMKSNGIGIDYPEINPVSIARATKDDEEISFMKDTAKRTSKVMQKTIDYFKDSKTDSNFVYKNNEKVTVGDVKKYIKINMVIEGLENTDDMIVASGPKSSNMHYKGDDCVPIKSHSPIVIDLYPRCHESLYFTDMTRTIVIGNVDKEVRKVYSDVINTYDYVADKILEDVQIKDVFDGACSFFESKGHMTYRKDEKTKEGFIHQLGHGVGLDIHENPSIGMFNNETFKNNMIFAVEPGLYFPNRYGIRVEDTLLIKNNKLHNLIALEKRL